MTRLVLPVWASLSTSTHEPSPRWASLRKRTPRLIAASTCSRVTAAREGAARVVNRVAATTTTGGWTWTVVLVAAVGVLTVTARRRVVLTSPPAVLRPVRGGGDEEPARQSAPGRPGRPQPRAPGAQLRASILLPAGQPTG